MNRTLPRLITFLSWVLLLAVGIVLAVAHPRFQFGTLVGDDAGYYLAIARNACLGHGFSFDRVHATNGFNPLMPLLLIPLDRLFIPSLDLLGCLRIGTLTTWLVMVLGAWPLQLLGKRLLAAGGFPEAVRPFAVSALLLLYAGFLALKGYYGMDAFLVLALGLAYLARVASHGLLSRGTRAALTDGALLGATVLARVDTLPFAVAAFLVMMQRVRTGAGPLRAVVVRALTFAGVVVPYLLWNRLGFGDWLPISARLKSTFPHLDLAASLETVLHSSLNYVDQLVLFVTLALALAWLIGCWSGWLKPAPTAKITTASSAHDAMLVFALYLAARLGWLLAFSRLDVQGSYFILASPFAALVLLFFAGRPGSTRVAAIATSVLVLATVGLVAGKLLKVLPEVRAIAAGRGDEWEIGRRLHNAVTDDDVLYGGAFGLVGYVTDRPWINGDGVANDRAYQDAIRDHDLVGYLRRARVTHVVALASPTNNPSLEPVTLTILSTLYGATDSLVVRPDRIVLREHMRRNAGSELWLVRMFPE